MVKKPVKNLHAIFYSFQSLIDYHLLIYSPYPFADTWKVEIHVKNKAVDTFCYGVLISEEHVLTSSECEWTSKSDFGRVPVAKFPEIFNGSISIPLHTVCFLCFTIIGQVQQNLL